METLSEATERLQARGFREPHRAEAGQLVAHDGRRFAPGDLRVLEVVRFEGESDPADSSILFALETPGGELRGLYSAVYGAGVAPDDVGVIPALASGRGAAVRPQMKPGLERGS